MLSLLSACVVVVVDDASIVSGDGGHVELDARVERPVSWEWEIFLLFPCFLSLWMDADATDGSSPHPELRFCCLLPSFFGTSSGGEDDSVPDEVEEDGDW